jgi:hypothetical protein
LEPMPQNRASLFTPYIYLPCQYVGLGGHRAVGYHGVSFAPPGKAVEFPMSLTEKYCGLVPSN